jgi:hypothetical protein
MKLEIRRNNEKILTKDDIDNFEKEINGKLPEDYKKFMLENNGGVIENFNRYYFSDEIFYLYEFFPLDDILEADIGELSDDDYLPENWIPIAENGDSGVFFLSIKGDNFGKIYFCEPVHQLISKDSILISDNFDNLIHNLKED